MEYRQLTNQGFPALSGEMAAKYLPAHHCRPQEPQEFGRRPQDNSNLYVKMENGSVILEVPMQ